MISLKMRNLKLSSSVLIVLVQSSAIFGSVNSASSVNLPGEFAQ